MLTFEITHTSSRDKGRLGRLCTPHGCFETPAFIFCATKAAMKGLSPWEMRQAHTQIILSNTYHLMLQPGADLIDAAGGLHDFMGWDGPMLTDSGGFQIFSLGHGSVAAEIKGHRSFVQERVSHGVRITEEGAHFKSYWDGKPQLLTPETSIQIQRKLGADLIVVLDECTPYHVERSYTEASMHRSHRWALRSHQEFLKPHPRTQGLYGIVQGGVYEDLRRESATFVRDHDFFGCAIGGSLGATKQQMHDVVTCAMSYAASHRPTHLLGIGGMADILNGVRLGVDTFDCVHPTRLARHGGALVPFAVRAEYSDPLKHRVEREHINLRNAVFRSDRNPIDPTCTCHTCQRLSRSYLHHLLRVGEMLGTQAINIHNVFTMNRLLQDIRQGIRDDTLEDVQKYWIG